MVSGLSHKFENSANARKVVRIYVWSSEAPDHFSDSTSQSLDNVGLFESPDDTVVVNIIEYIEFQPVT